MQKCSRGLGLRCLCLLLWATEAMSDCLIQPDANGHVDMPADFTNVPKLAFEGCDRLKSVSLHDGITSIGDGAFKGSSVAQIEISERVTSLGEEVFQNSNLLNISLPDTVSYLGERVFSNCQMLNNVTLGNGLTEIPIEAFKNTPSLTSLCATGCALSIGNNIQQLRSSAFCGSGLQVVEVPDSVTELGDSLFERCSQLQNATLGKGITIIPDFCFVGCSELTTVFLGSSIRRIGEGAFSNTKPMEIAEPTSDSPKSSAYEGWAAPLKPAPYQGDVSTPKPPAGPPAAGDEAASDTGEGTGPPKFRPSDRPKDPDRPFSDLAVLASHIAQLDS